MYHTPCATQLDEDVWGEIRVQRESFTGSFELHFPS